MTLLQSYLEFIKELELLKNITRTAWTSAGKHCRAFLASGFIYRNHLARISGTGWEKASDDGSGT